MARVFIFISLYIKRGTR